MGNKVFIMCKIGRWEMPLDVDHNVVQAYNMMHVRLRVQLDLGISGLKWKWKHFTKRFDSTKPKYSHLFWVATLLIKFLHMKHMNLTYKVKVIKMLTQLHMVRQGISNYRSKIDLILILNLSFMMTPRSLVVFKLLIFTLFNLWLLISTLPTKKVFRISKVVEKQAASVAMLLDWICSIFALIINLSLSLANGLESSETLGLNILGQQN